MTFHRAFDADAACCCDWPDTCGGSGVFQCDGCGGDICVCRCGGEMDCPGCEDCEGALDVDEPNEDAPA